MIDLTPLDVRKKRGDFRRGLRGYDPEEVDVFLEVVADRLEELVKENLTLKERAARLGDQVSSQEGRERAVQDALVTAQALRQEIREQAEKEAALIRREAEARMEKKVQAAHAKMLEFRRSMAELERQRARFLKSFRLLLERELDGVEIEEKRAPLEDVTFDLDLSGGTRSLTSLLDEAGPPAEPAASAGGADGADGSGAAGPAAGELSDEDIFGDADLDEESPPSGADAGAGAPGGTAGDEEARGSGDAPAAEAEPRKGQPIVDMFGERKETEKEEE